jgi:hypothetical protein
VATDDVTAPDTTPGFVCPEADHHGNPFRYCPVKGCGWMETPTPPSGNTDNDARAERIKREARLLGGCHAIDKGARRSIGIDADRLAIDLRAARADLARAWDEGYAAGGFDSTTPPGKWEDNPYLTAAENAERRARHIERLKRSGYPESAL